MRRIERLLRSLEIPGADRMLRPWLAGRGVIFVLHRAARAGTQVLDPDMTVTADLLDNALRLAHSEGWSPVAISEVPGLLRSSSRKRFVSFTFDDGYRDNMTVALPVFQAHQVPLCIFIATGLIDRAANYWWGCLARLIESRGRLDPGWPGFPCGLPLGSSEEKQAAFARLESWVHQDLEKRGGEVLEWCRSLGIDDRAAMDEDFLTWDEIRALSRDPLVTIGAHGDAHCRFARLDEPSLRSELAGARQRIEAETGRPVHHLAYPYGGRAACGEREFQFAAQAGYATAVTTRRGALFAEHAGHLLALPRQRLTEGTPDLRSVRRGLSGTSWLLHRGPRIVLD